MELQEINENIQYKDIDFSDCRLEGVTFQECVFERCFFREMNLVNSSFKSCKFYSSEWILLKLNNAILFDLEFHNSKILGCNLGFANKFVFSIDFYSSLIVNCVFYSNDMTNRVIEDCTIKECDFMETDLSKSVFHKSVFQGTRFRKCHLYKTDFSKATGYMIDPFDNDIQNGIFSYPEVTSFLSFLPIKIKE